MMLFPLAKASTSSGSAALSVGLHVVLIATAVYATGVRSMDVDRVIAERVSYLKYLPPPDRVRSTEDRDMVLRYVRQGTGGVPLPERADGRVFRLVGAAGPDVAAGALGTDVVSQAPTKEVVSTDSVYSVLDVEETATRTEGSAAPVYPPELLREHTEGSVTARFVVDTLGHSDPESIVVLESTNPAFAQSVRRAIPLMSFSPATMFGRKVRQMVEQRFGFRIMPADAPSASSTRPVP